ncbi:MAG: ATP-binding cassette domain-containing protein [Clostridium fessum]
MEDREKAAIVGINGAGKSTLLKIIVGRTGAADEGSVTICQGQNPRLPGTAPGSAQPVPHLMTALLEVKQSDSR